MDPTTFQRSRSGWTARWRGIEQETHFDVAYKSDARRWEIRQVWRGLDGGIALLPARLPLDQVIAQALYAQFPSNWDGAAKSQIESSYQVTFVEHPENAAIVCGIPDGVFRTIVFPVAVRNLRPIQHWIREVLAESLLAYPVTVEARLLFQALNYLEGKAPAWTTQEDVALKLSLDETGLMPLGLPVREQANDGSVAWTLRRRIYFLFISLPFAGLTEFMKRMATVNGPIRTPSDPNLRFELRPLVLPAGFEVQTESASFWDQARTTRSFLQFAGPGEANMEPTVSGLGKAELDVEATLERLEAISRDVVATVEQIFQQAIKGRAG